MNYKLVLLSLLGLAATATDAEITAAAATDKKEDAADATSQNRKITALETEIKVLRDEAITSDLERFADVIDDPASAKELLQLNRALGVKLYTQLQTKLAAIDAAAAGRKVIPLYQKNRATAPDGKKFLTPDAEQEAATAKFRAIESRAQTLVTDRKLPFSQAFDIAKAEIGA